MEFERRTLRTVRARYPQHARDLVSAHSFSRSSSRIALRCAWLSLFRFPVPFRFLPPSGSVPGARFRSRVAPAPAVPHSSPAMLPLSLRPARRTMASAICRSRFDLFDRFRHRCCRLPLRFQKQCRFSENAFANHARTFAPRGIKVARPATCIATVLHEYGGHALTAVRAGDPRDRHQIISSRSARQDSHRALAAGPVPATTRPAPVAYRAPSSRCGRSGAPVQRASNRETLLHLRKLNASPVRERFPAGSSRNDRDSSRASGFAHRPRTVASTVSPRSGSSAAMRLLAPSITR